MKRHKGAEPSASRAEVREKFRPTESWWVTGDFKAKHTVELPRILQNGASDRHVYVPKFSAEI